VTVIVTAQFKCSAEPSEVRFPRLSCEEAASSNSDTSVILLKDEEDLAMAPIGVPTRWVEERASSYA